MRGYAKIEAWKLADDLTVAVYERTRPFLGGDLRFNRSIAPRILFIPANIVDGASRENKRDYLHFLLRLSRA